MDLTSASPDHKKQCAKLDDALPVGSEAQPTYQLDRSASPQSIMQLQKSLGNQNVQRLLRTSPHLARPRSTSFLHRKALSSLSSTSEEMVQDEQHETEAVTDTPSPISGSDAPPTDAKSTISRKTAESIDDETMQDEQHETLIESPSLLSGSDTPPNEARSTISRETDDEKETEEWAKKGDAMWQRDKDKPKNERQISQEYTGENREKMANALKDAQEDSEQSAGERWQETGKDFGLGMGDAFMGPLAYAIPDKRKKLKDDWAKADNVLAHGTGGWGKFVTGAKRTNIVLGEIANILGWLSMMCMIAAPFTKGLSAVPGTILSIASGAVSAVMTVLNGIIIVGQGIRMSQLPKNSIEYAMAARSLIEEAANFITNGIGAGLGLAGAGGAKGAIKGITDKVVKGSVRGTLKAMAKPIGKDLGVGAAQTVTAGAITGALGGAIGEGSHKQVKDSMKGADGVDTSSVQRETDVLQREPGGVSMAELQQQEEKLALVSQLGMDFNTDNQQFNATSANAMQQFNTLDGKSNEMPMAQLEDLSKKNGAVTEAVNGGGAGDAVTNAGEDKAKVNALKAQVDQAGAKVGVQVQVNAPEPSDEEMKAASKATPDGQVSRSVDPETAGAVQREMAEQHAEGAMQAVEVKHSTGGGTIQRGFWSKLKGAFKKVGSAIVSGAKALANKIAEFAKKAWAKIKEWVKAALNAIKNAILTIVKKIVEAFKKLFNKIKEIVNKGKEIIGVIRGEKQQAVAAQQVNQENQQKAGEVQSQIQQATTAKRQQIEEQKKAS